MKSKRVLLIGIDGCCPEAIKLAKTPVMDQLCVKGAFNFNMRTENISLSGPGWMSILTGYGQKTHGIVDNKFIDFESDKFPSFLERLKKTGFKTASVVAWSPINKYICTMTDYKFENKSDDLVVAEVQNLLSENNFNAIFMHLDAIDATGHSKGYESSNYINAVSKVDISIGKIIDSLHRRTNYNEEDWLIIITTDHGGWKKDHLEMVDKIKRTFCILVGSNIKQGEFQGSYGVTDITPTILEYFNELQADWNLDGQVMDVFKNNANENY
jgi:predicted AlkP superfamily pyrophosphatase or phosphodiesterase